MATAEGSGTLFLVATPIGNLEDITLRAVRILKTVGLIAAEDTRRTQRLLKHYGINKPLVSYHEHNEVTRTDELIRALQAGRDVAVVSDAGMPGISDPGFRIVKRAIEEGISICAIPGPSAITTSLAVSGLATHRFSFLGFLPRSPGPRRHLLEGLRCDPGTLIFYESPHRVEKTLKDMLEILGDRSAAIARELTKLHEEVIRGRISRLQGALRGRECKGEFCILVSGSGGEAPSKIADRELLIKEIKEIQKTERLGLKEAVAKVACAHAVSKRELYQRAVADRIEEG